MRFFTSDLHFDDDRFSMLFRPFKTLGEQHKTIIENWNAVVKPEDEVFIVGDVSVTDEGLKYIDLLNGRKYLIMGNYDDPRDRTLLLSKFESVSRYTGLLLKDGSFVHLNHYPEKAKPHDFNLVGHVHSLWKVQRNMINVSTDTWNFKPVSEDEIIYCINGIKNHYDKNVFSGELQANTPINIIHTEKNIEVVGPTIFLAGPTPRDKNVPSWRPAFTEELLRSGFRGTIIIPEPEFFQENFDYDKQIEWEDEGLTKAHLIVFWVPRNLKDMPGFTTNIEFGEWMKSGKIVLGFPPKAEKMRYLTFKADKYSIPVYNTTSELCSYIVNYFK
jgi:calcineurin-like phosphoesterase family protein